VVADAEEDDCAGFGGTRAFGDWHDAEYGDDGGVGAADGRSEGGADAVFQSAEEDFCSGNLARGVIARRKSLRWSAICRELCGRETCRESREREFFLCYGYRRAGWHPRVRDLRSCLPRLFPASELSP
jgi:hypothetical protein